MKQVQRTSDAATTFESLVRLITSSEAHPLDVAHVAAMLELNGWTDGRALNLGYEDVFELAEALWAAAASDSRQARALPRDEPAWYIRVVHVIRLYIRGLSFAAPMLLSSASVLALKYSLWSYVKFDTEIATAIALGTFASFLVAGGFTQSIARRGLFYISQEQYGLARWSSFRLVLAGFGATLVVALAMVLFVLFIPVFPWRIVSVAVLYFVPLTLIWLGIGLLYMLNQEPAILALIALGIAVVYVLFEILNVPMMTAQVVGMSLVVIGSFGLDAYLLFYLEMRNAREFGQGIVMRWSQVGYSLAPFFVYGIVYFALTFVDRVMAWSRPQEFHPYFLWFLGDYELGVDWALWTLILPMGIVEIYIDGLFQRLKRRSEWYTVDRIAEFNEHFRREHLRTTFVVAVAGLVGIFMVLGIIIWLKNIGFIPFSPLDEPHTRFVFFWAAPAFSVVTVGLQSVLVLFSLNEPWPAARACGIALLANVVVGFLASRFFYYWWAVLGLVVGAFLFAVLTTREALKVLSRLDYFLMRGT
jgi:hypothetical protein